MNNRDTMDKNNAANSPGKGVIEEDRNIVTLTNQFGRDVSFEFLDLIAYEGKEYVVLLPLDENGEVVMDGEEAGVEILEFEGEIDDESEGYCSVENQEILDAVFEIFRKKVTSWL